MRKFLFLSKNLFFLISFAVLFGSIYFYIDFKQVIQKHEQEIHDIEIKRAYKTAKSILPQIQTFTDKSISSLVDYSAITFEISRILSYYRNDEFKYIYLVYIDKYGSYRYLADGSEIQEKAAQNQKFTPSKPNLWRKLIKEKKDVYDIQDNAEGLWLTYLAPVVTNGAINVILVLDISTIEYQEFSKLLIPLESFLNSFLFVLVLIFIFILLQGVLFYTQYKNSMLDSLTKLYNRHFLDTITFKNLSDKTAIFMIDIDHFKSVNDAYGHDVGDIVIASIAKKLLTATRLDDRVIRYGGEEFLVIIKVAKNKSDIINIAQRIRKSVDEETIRLDENIELNVTVSIGVNLHVKSCKSMREAIEKADDMLYKAKNEGRNRVEVY